MRLVPCPNCGPRNSADLWYGGEIHARPDPATTSSTQWRTYLYMRDNLAGWVEETWYCRSGCRRWFTLRRNTVTNQFQNPPQPGCNKGGAA